MRLKLVLGSMSPVISSTVEIWALIEAVTRSIRPSRGQLDRCVRIGFGMVEGVDIREEFGGSALIDPGAGQGLEICLSWMDSSSCRCVSFVIFCEWVSGIA